MLRIIKQFCHAIWVTNEKDYRHDPMWIYASTEWSKQDRLYAYQQLKIKQKEQNGKHI